jgi:hypothetical protein
VRLSLPTLCLLFAVPLAAQVAILQIRVIEGDGGVHLPGSRSARALTVQITEETGRPVEGATVSFQMPEDGPGGLLAGGLRTDVALSDATGRAVLHGVQWNRTPGRFGIRIIAAREQARAGMISYQYIADQPGTAARAPAAASPPPVAPTASKPAPAAVSATHPSKGKWVVLTALAAGGAVAAGLLAGKSNSGNTAQPPAAAPALSSTPILSIGNPVVTVGHP